MSEKEFECVCVCVCLCECVCVSVCLCVCVCVCVCDMKNGKPLKAVTCITSSPHRNGCDPATEKQTPVHPLSHSHSHTHTLTLTHSPSWLSTYTAKTSESIS